MDPHLRFKEIMKGDKPNYKKKSISKKINSAKIKGISKVIRNQLRKRNNKNRSNKISL